MNRGDVQQRGEQDTTVLAVRRRFLIDLAWPMSTTDLADMFGLPQSSEDVTEAELVESHVAMKLLIATLPRELVAGPAADMAKLINWMQTDDEDTLAAWLMSYTLAVIAMIRSLEIDGE